MRWLNVLASLAGLLLAHVHAEHHAAAREGCNVESSAKLALPHGEAYARNLIGDLQQRQQQRQQLSQQPLESTADCGACKPKLRLLKKVAQLGDFAFVRTIQDLCKLLKTEDDDVCDGAIAREGPIIASALRSMTIGSHTSELFCITFLGLCQYPAVTPRHLSFPSKRPVSGRPLPSGKPPIKVVHISDVHIDELYVPGSSANCTKPICCRSYTTQDAPGNNDAPAGPNGDHSCDSPVSLEESMYAAIKELVPDAAFTIFTGDIIDHAVWNTSQPYNEFVIDDTYSRMAASLKLVYGTAGNHEQTPTNAFQPNNLGSGAQWVYKALSSAWERWIGPGPAATSQTTGAYSVKVPNGNLRIISLNTNMYYVQNYYLYQNTMNPDPNGQLAWLVAELDAAESAKENVYIIGHMPFGLPDVFHDGSNYLDQIVNRYSSTIAAMFFGHTHLDQFQITYSDYTNRAFSNARVMSYIAPSLTPISGMPAFRVYDVDPVSFAVLDVTSYMADMTDAAFQSPSPVSAWKKYYSAAEAYGSLVKPALAAGAELTAAFWHNVTAAFEQDKDAFEAYMARKSRGWQVGSCPDVCMAAEICKLRASRSQDNCVIPKPGVHLTKRAPNSSSATHGEERDECGISVIRATINALAVDPGAMEALWCKTEALINSDLTL